uniref:phenylalanine--tRNA ligase n=1 Tax=Porphyridium sordidum TaxID=28024 RepID=A0A1C9CDN4_PORSO|nr:phenylalanyl-tRNA synthetase beta chain [Porphyridium sordidum]AOM66499.1 phenylalanyl-tRNA synthetase beta chain [Porphyridium sordidum]
MKISLNHLNRLFNFKEIALEKLIENLSLSTCEIESVKFEKDSNGNKDTILEIVSTANRSDLLSYLGIAREISILFNQQKLKADLETDNIIIPHNIDTSNSKNYLAQITGKIISIKNYKSPLWIQNILSVAGIDIFGDINDTTNYIMLETGFPLLLFKESDYKNDQEISYYIKKNSIVFTENENNLVLTGTLFSSKNIRQISKLSNIKNEITQRYERGLTLEDLEYTYKRSIYLLQEIHGVDFNYSSINLSYASALEISKKPIKISISNVINKLGINSQKKQIDHSTVKNILINLGFFITELGDAMEVIVPYYRVHDISREIDLIEEIGRIYGFNHFVDTIPRIRPYSCLTSQEILIRKMRSRLKILGFNEFINYSLNSQPATLTNKYIELQNPLTNDFRTLRQTLLYNILNNIDYNLKFSNGIINGYEIGRVFHSQNNAYKEQNFLSLVLFGNTFINNWNNNNNNNNIDWFCAKGISEELLRGFSDKINWTKEKLDPNDIYKVIFHSYNFSQLFINGKYLGIFGQLSPKLLKDKNIKHKVYALEINTEMLLSDYNINIKHNTLYKQYSIYPCITRDITLNVNKTVMAQEIKDAILKNMDNILAKVEIISFYEGHQIDKSKKNISLRLYYQSNDRTLTIPEVEIVHSRIFEQLTLEFA